MGVVEPSGVCKSMMVHSPPSHHTTPHSPIPPLYLWPLIVVQFVVLAGFPCFTGALAQSKTSPFDGARPVLLGFPCVIGVAAVFGSGNPNSPLQKGLPPSPSGLFCPMGCSVGVQASTNTTNVFVACDPFHKIRTFWNMMKTCCKQRSKVRNTSN